MHTAPHDDGLSPRRPARRSLWAVGLIVLGFLIARHVPGDPPPLIWFGAALIALALAAATRGRTCRAALAVSLLLLASGWWCVRITDQARENDRLSRVFGGAPITLSGVLAGAPEPFDPPRGALGAFVAVNPGTMLDLRVSGVLAEDGSSTPRRARIRVRVDQSPASAPDWARAGSPVTITGTFSPVAPALNPGEFDRRAWAAQENVLGDLDAPSWSLCAQRDPATLGLGERIASWRLSAQDRLHARARAALGLGAAADPADRRADARALLGALLLGERAVELREANSAFERLGLLHLVAISGFNLAVMAALAVFLFRFTGERTWLEPAVVGVLVLGYMLVLPAQTPILRAGVMVLALLVTDALGRRFDRLTVLGWVAVAMLAYRPLDAFALGFQLSFGIVGALLLLAEVAKERLFGITIRGLVAPAVPHGKPRMTFWLGHIRKRAAKGFKAHVSASVLAWAIALPVIACHTGLVSPLAPLATLLVLPLAVIVLWVGYIALLVGVLVPGAGEFSGRVLERLSGLFVDWVVWLDSAFSLSFRLPSISPVWAAAAIAVVVYWFLRGHLRDRRAWTLTLALVIWGCAEVALRPLWAARHPLRIDALAVGEGTCLLVRSKGDAMLWDCGSRSPGIGERLVPRAVRALGAWKVKTVVLSGIGMESFSGLPDVLEPLGVERVYVTGQFLRAARADGGGPAARLLAILNERGIDVKTIETGDVFTLGGARITVLRPTRDQVGETAADVALCAEMVITSTSGDRSVLCAGAVRGDPPRAAPPIAALCASGRAPEDTITRWLAALDPAMVIWSTRQTPGMRPLGAESRGSTTEHTPRQLTIGESGAISIIIQSDGALVARTHAAPAR